jgi:uncharacterized protein
MLTDILLLSVGVLIGGMNAIAGGGMLVGFPVLLAIGVPAIVANATLNIINLPGQMASAYGYRKYLRKVPLIYTWLLLPLAIGAFFGSLILRNTAFDSFERLVPGLILFAVVLFAFQPLLHFHFNSHMKRKPVDNRPLIYIGLALLPLSIYGGYFGAGFGFVVLAFLGFTKIHDVHKMNALKNVAASVMAFVSIIVLFGADLIDWRHGLVMAAGATIGGYFGSRLALKISSHTIRLIVISIGLVTATYLFLRQY